MADPQKTALDVLDERARQIGFGEWHVCLIVYDGRITGFDQIETPKIKFRERQVEKK